MFVQNYIHGASVVVWQAAVKVIHLLGIGGFNKRKNNENKNYNTASSSQPEAPSKAPSKAPANASLSRLPCILTLAEKLLLLICFDSSLLLLED